MNAPNSSALRADLVSWLSQRTEVQGLIASRIYPTQAPPGDGPFVVYRVLSGAADECLDGPSGLGQEVWQFLCVSRDAWQAAQIAEVLSQALERLNEIRLAEGAAQLGTTEIDYCEPQTTTDNWELADDGSGTGWCTRLIQVRIWYATLDA